MIKKCSVCGHVKPLPQYSKFARSADGLKSECKQCSNKRSRRYRAENSAEISDRERTYRENNRDTILERKRGYNSDPVNRERNVEKCRSYYAANKTKFADRKFVRNYGISLTEYNKMVSSQSGQCAICKGVFGFDKTTRGHVDHDHVTGKVRGLLCSNCNHGIGKFKDDPEVIREAARYVEQGGVDCESVYEERGILMV